MKEELSYSHVIVKCNNIVFNCKSIFFLTISTKFRNKIKKIIFHYIFYSLYYNSLILILLLLLYGIHI